MAKVITTALGDVEVSLQGSGTPVLIIHGSPGGVDGAVAMSRFLSPEEFRTVCVSRPGYLNTPLPTDDPSIDREADLLAAVLETLDIGRVGVLAWSGGGPSAYRLAVRHPKKVSALVAIAACSGRWVAPKPDLSQRLLFGTALGTRLIELMSRYRPAHLVKGALEGEGSVRGKELDDLARSVMADADQRQLVLETALTVSTAGERKAGWENDVRNFAKTESLELEHVLCPTLLVHGDADTDAVPEYSHSAHAKIPNSKLVIMRLGTHLAFYADPQAAEVQEQARAWFKDHQKDQQASI